MVWPKLQAAPPVKAERVPKKLILILCPTAVELGSADAQPEAA
jgi:hypothetical protein